MLEIAGGVVLGGVILYALYGFRAEIAKAMFWPFWGMIAIASLGLIGTVGIGAWRIAERVFGHVATKPTIPEGLFAWAVVLAVLYVAFKA